MSFASLLRLKARVPVRPAVTREPRSIALDGRHVPYLLRRSDRKTLALQLDSRGVRVSVPTNAAVADIERFIRAHGQWLLARLDAVLRQPCAHFEIADGCILPLCGERFRVRTVGGVRKTAWRVSGDGVEELWLAGGRDPVEQLTKALRARALGWFGGRVDEYCHRLGRPAPQVRLSSARTRWGSCSSRSGIRLHWRLIHLPPNLIDYVVAHEVAHLVEMNHSLAFWKIVEALYPDWRSARAALRAASHELPLFGNQSPADAPIDET